MRADDGQRSAGEDGSRESAAREDPIAILFGELVRLIFQHATLARAELADSAGAFGIALLLFVGAAAIGFTAIILLLIAAGLGLAVFIPIWSAFLLVGFGTLLAAALLWMLARAYARRCTLVPHRAAASLRRQLIEIGGQWR